MSIFRDQETLRRLELNPIITTSSPNAAQQPPPHQTSSPSLSSNFLSAQFEYNPATYPSVIAAARQYNTQQWTQSANVISDVGTHFSTERPQDPEGTLIEFAF
jgi:hypothetical protein